MKAKVAPLLGLSEGLKFLAVPTDVIHNIEVPKDMNSAQESVFGFLTLMIGSMKHDERNFLCFVTGS